MLLQYYFYTVHAAFSQTFPWLQIIFSSNLDLRYQNSPIGCLGQPEITFKSMKSLILCSIILLSPLTVLWIPILLCKFSYPKRDSQTVRGGRTTAFSWMSTGNKDIVRNSSSNSLRAAPWRLAKQLPSDTLKLLQQAAVAMKFLEARKTVLLFQSGAQTGDLSPAFMSLAASSLPTL